MSGGDYVDTRVVTVVTVVWVRVQVVVQVQ